MIPKCKLCNFPIDHRIQFGFTKDGWSTATVAFLCLNCLEKLINLWGIDVLVSSGVLPQVTERDLNIRMIEAVGTTGEIG